jgi:ribonucleoside-triphosphate reductase
MARCNQKTEVYSRVCGYHRPVSAWNLGAKSQFKDRKPYVLSKGLRESHEDMHEMLE